MTVDLWLEESHNDHVIQRLRLRGCLESQTTPFQRLEVYDSFAYGKLLKLGGQVALAERDEALYNEGLVHPAMQCHPAPERVLVLGGGDGGVAREAIRYSACSLVRVVEIDEQVVAVARRHFPACAAGLDQPGVELILDDAHRHLDRSDETWDLILVDGAELHDPAADLVHPRRFSHECHRRLAPGGVLVAPLGSPVSQAEHCRTALAGLKERFQRVDVFLVAVPSLPGGTWCIAWCTDGDHDPLTLHHATEPFVAGLEWWEPAIQVRVFQVPKPTRRAIAP